jgi:hypothetical protein
MCIYVKVYVCACVCVCSCMCVCVCMYVSMYACMYVSTACLAFQFCLSVSIHLPVSVHIQRDSHTFTLGACQASSSRSLHNLTPIYPDLHACVQAECHICPLGAFQASPGQSFCNPCSPAMYKSWPGIPHSCSSCEPGTFAPASGSSACLSCDPGSFSASGCKQDATRVLILVPVCVRSRRYTRHASLVFKFVYRLTQILSYYVCAFTCICTLLVT